MIMKLVETSKIKKFIVKKGGKKKLHINGVFQENRTLRNCSSAKVVRHKSPPSPYVLLILTIIIYG